MLQNADLGPQYIKPASRISVVTLICAFLLYMIVEKKEEKKKQTAKIETKFMKCETIIYS